MVERRGLGHGALGPGGDLAALLARSGPVRQGLSICATMSMLSSIGCAVVLDQDRDHRACRRRLDHRSRCRRRAPRSRQMRPALERRRHAHAKAQRAMLEQIRASCRAPPCGARAGCRQPGRRPATGAHSASPFCEPFANLAAILGEEREQRVHGLEAASHRSSSGRRAAPSPARHRAAGRNETSACWARA